MRKLTRIRARRIYFIKVYMSRLAAGSPRHVFVLFIRLMSEVHDLMCEDWQ